MKTVRLKYNELRPGDLVTTISGHLFLFLGWHSANPDRTQTFLDIELQKVFTLHNGVAYDDRVTYEVIITDDQSQRNFDERTSTRRRGQ